MALKKKVAKEVVEETVVETPQEETPVITEAEKEAIQNMVEKETEASADTRRLQLATNVVSKQFNLDPSYRVSKFDDKGKVVALTLENSNFIINVTIKDSDRHNMHIED